MAMKAWEATDRQRGAEAAVSGRGEDFGQRIQPDTISQ
jgi:hypothetical protein